MLTIIYVNERKYPKYMQPYTTTITTVMVIIITK